MIDDNIKLNMEEVASEEADLSQLFLVLANKARYNKVIAKQVKESNCLKILQANKWMSSSDFVRAKVVQRLKDSFMN